MRRLRPRPARRLRRAGPDRPRLAGQVGLDADERLPRLERLERRHRRHRLHRLPRRHERGAPTGTSYTVSGLSCGTSYLFAVEARDAAGNHSVQATLTASTSACPVPDTQAPTTPGSPAKSGSTQTSVSLAWSASSDDTGITGYTVYRDGTSAGAPTGTSYTVSGLSCGTSYLFAVEARDAAGNHSVQATLTASTDSCSASSANLYLSPSGSDSNPCSRTAPCLSLNRAYRVAEPGDVVDVADGTYGNQTINFDSTKTSTSRRGVPCRGGSGTVLRLRRVVLRPHHGRGPDVPDGLENVGRDRGLHVPERPCPAPLHLRDARRQRSGWRLRPLV